MQFRIPLSLLIPCVTGLLALLAASSTIALLRDTLLRSEAHNNELRATLTLNTERSLFEERMSMRLAPLRLVASVAALREIPLPNAAELDMRSAAVAQWLKYWSSFSGSRVIQFMFFPHLRSLGLSSWDPDVPIAFNSVPNSSDPTKSVYESYLFDQRGQGSLGALIDRGPQGVDFAPFAAALEAPEGHIQWSNPLVAGNPVRPQAEMLATVRITGDEPSFQSTVASVTVSLSKLLMPRTSSGLHVYLFDDKERLLAQSRGTAIFPRQEGRHSPQDCPDSNRGMYCFEHVSILNIPQLQAIRASCPAMLQASAEVHPDANATAHAECEGLLVSRTTMPFTIGRRVHFFFLIGVQRFNKVGDEGELVHHIFTSIGGFVATAIVLAFLAALVSGATTYSALRPLRVLTARVRDPAAVIAMRTACPSSFSLPSQCPAAAASSADTLAFGHFPCTLHNHSDRVPSSGRSSGQGKNGDEDEGSDVASAPRAPLVLQGGEPLSIWAELAQLEAMFLATVEKLQSILGFVPQYLLVRLTSRSGKQLWQQQQQQQKTEEPDRRRTSHGSDGTRPLATHSTSRRASRARRVVAVGSSCSSTIAHDAEMDIDGVGDGNGEAPARDLPTHENLKSSVQHALHRASPDDLPIAPLDVVLDENGVFCPCRMTALQIVVNSEFVNSESAQPFFSMAIVIIQSARGVVDAVSSSTLSASFNCHLPQSLHQEAACIAALEIQKQAPRALTGHFSIMIDASEGKSVTIGTGAVRSRLVICRAVDYTRKLAPLLLQRRCAVGVTERVARHSPFMAVPLECVRLRRDFVSCHLPPSAGERHGGEVILELSRGPKCDDFHPSVLHYVGAFQEMLQGRFAAAHALWLLARSETDDPTVRERITHFVGTCAARMRRGGQGSMPYCQEETIGFATFPNEEMLLQHPASSGGDGGDPAMLPCVLMTRQYPSREDHSCASSLGSEQRVAPGEMTLPAGMPEFMGSQSLQEASIASRGGRGGPQPQHALSGSDLAQSRGSEASGAAGVAGAGGGSGIATGARGGAGGGSGDPALLFCCDSISGSNYDLPACSFRETGRE